MKKKLLQYIKTRHFKNRQKDRSLSDAKIKEAIVKGEITERDGSTIFTYKNVEVVVAADEDVLVTIIKKGDQVPQPKLISKAQAEKIRKNVKESAPRAEGPAAPKPASPDSKQSEEREIDLEAYLRGQEKNSKA